MSLGTRTVFFNVFYDVRFCYVSYVCTFSSVVFRGGANSLKRLAGRRRDDAVVP